MKSDNITALQPAPDALREADFKAAMRRLAATVTVISTVDGHAARAMTATAVTSLSMAPPSLLVCVNANARFHGALASSDAFCVNLLHKSQADISRIFSRPVSNDEFRAAKWLFEDGFVRLQDSQASILCRKAEQFTYGTHTIFIGTVERTLLREDIAPLVFQDGRYGQCLPLEA